MRYILPILVVLFLVSAADAHGNSNFRSSFRSRNDFNSGFQQGFRAAQQRQQFNGHRFQQFNGRQQFNGHQQQFRSRGFFFGVN